MTLPFQLSVKKYVVGGTILFFLCLLVFYGYQRIQVKHAANTLFMLQQSTRILTYSSSNQSSPSQKLSFSSIIEQTAKRHQITLSAITIQERELNISLPPMLFNQLVAWLAELQREYDIRVSMLQITALPSQGMIRIDVLRLQRLPSFSGGA